jgi:dTMP kinase
VSRRRLDRLIVLEGIDGAGTTTQTTLLVNRIRQSGHKVWSTHEPTDSRFGLLARDFLSGELPATPEGAAYLFATDRWEHVFGDEGIIAHHDRADIVVCDRYYYSSLVYQSVNANPDLVAVLNAPFPDPGIVIFVDLPVEHGEERLAGRSRRDIYEHREFQELVRERYLRELETARATTEVAIVSGSDSEEEVHRNIWEAVRRTSIL